MAGELTIDGEIIHGVIVLTVNFCPELLIKKSSGIQFRKQLIQKYQNLYKGMAPKNSSCIIDIQSQEVGSALIRGLFELWKKVTEESGQVICSNFPPDYISSLTTLGLSGQLGFKMSETKEDAIKEEKNSRYRHMY